MEYDKIYIISISNIHFQQRRVQKKKSLPQQTLKTTKIYFMKQRILCYQTTVALAFSSKTNFTMILMQLLNSVLINININKVCEVLNEKKVKHYAQVAENAVYHLIAVILHFTIPYNMHFKAIQCFKYSSQYKSLLHLLTSLTP